MTDTRRFYKTQITITVLSMGGPVSPETPLSTIDERITDGEWSGRIEHDGGVEVDAPQMAAELVAQGSAPEFFGLNPDGTDCDSEEADTSPGDDASG